MPARVPWFLLGCLSAAVPACSQPVSSTPQAPPIASGAAPAQSATSRTFLHQVVAADHELASLAGAEMLAKGGNAVDAAVATSFALSVVRPDSCGIGGGGFMVIHLEHPPGGEKWPIEVCIDFRERCPAGIGPDTFEHLPPGSSERGGYAVAIPGEVAGLMLALERYGTLDRATVLAPAIRLARAGCAADAHDATTVATMEKYLAARVDKPWPGSESLLRWYGPGRTVGGWMRAPEQAKVFEEIELHGADGFSKGPVAEAIVRAITAHGGVMTLEDLANYRPKEVLPLRATLESKGPFAGRTIVTMPLPSSGGLTLIQIMRLLELRCDLLTGHGVGSAPYIHLLTEASKLAFADRAAYLGDPAYMPIDPTNAILDVARLRERATLISGERSLDPAACTNAQPLQLGDDHGTSHFSVVDQCGNAVACTETTNLEFGSLVAVPEFGFVLNDQMDDFLTRRGEPNAFKLTQSERNLPAPGKRPLSSMTPTIVLDATGKVEMVCGASGGPRIISATTETLLNAMLFGMAGQAAVDAPRSHDQWMPDLLRLESADEATKSELARLGHTLGPMKDAAAVQFIQRMPEDAGWFGASDPRKGGKPAGE